MFFKEALTLQDLHVVTDTCVCNGRGMACLTLRFDTAQATLGARGARAMLRCSDTYLCVMYVKYSVLFCRQMRRYYPAERMPAAKKQAKPGTPALPSTHALLWVYVSWVYVSECPSLRFADCIDDRPGNGNGRRDCGNHSCCPPRYHNSWCPAP